MISDQSATRSSLIGPRRAVNLNLCRQDACACVLRVACPSDPQFVVAPAQQHQRHVQVPEDGRCGIAGGRLHLLGSRREDTDLSGFDCTESSCGGSWQDRRLVENNLD